MRSTIHASTPAYHPLLFSVFGSLFAFEQMLGWDIDFSALLLVLFWGWIFAYIVQYFFAKICRSHERGSFAALLLIVWFWFFEEIQKTLSSIPVLSEYVLRYKFLLPIFALALFLVLFILRKSNLSFKNVSRFLNLFVLILLLSEVAKLGFVYYQKASNAKQDALPAHNFEVLSSSIPSILPDVYFLLFDSHTGSNSLKKYWHYDDSAFVNKMKEQGFCFLENAQSNAPSTYHSLSATLNMAYDAEMNRRFPKIKMPGLHFKYISEAQVIRIFRSMGYEILNLSFFDLPGAKALYPSEFQMTFLERLWLKSFPGKIYIETYISFFTEYKLIPRLFNKTPERGNPFYLKQKIEEIARNKKSKPVFVYAHFMLPHAPFAYNQHGKILSLTESLDKSPKDKYFDQLLLADSLILSLADSILKNSNHEAVVFFQGDHGYRFLNEGPGSKEESFSILNAAHIPNCSEYFYKGMTPINTFSVLFDSLYGFQLGRKPDISFQGLETNLKE